MIGDVAARLHYTALFEMLRNMFLIGQSAPGMRPARSGVQETSRSNDRLNHLDFLSFTSIFTGLVILSGF